jgi:tetratricopeptide (TPR) repeat protein
LNAQAQLAATSFGDPEVALRDASAALEILEGHHDRSALIERANAFNCLGVAAHLQHQLDEAQKQHEASFEIRNSLNDTLGIARSLQNLGLILTARGDEQARQFFHRAIELHERAGDRTGIAHALSNLGWLEWRLGNLEESENYFVHLLEASQSWGENFNTSHALNNLGAVQFLQKKYWKAKLTYENALNAKYFAQNKINRAILLGNLAETCLRLQLFEDVNNDIKLALDLLQGNQNSHLLSDLHYWQAESYFFTGKYEEANYYFQNSFKFAQNASNKDRKALSLSRIARLEKDTIKAEQAIQLSDSPIVAVSFHLASTQINCVEDLMLQIDDNYEKAQICIDIFEITKDGNWKSKAKDYVRALAQSA